MEVEFTNITELVEYIQNLAPHVWEIYVRQMIVEGWRNVAWGIGSLFFTLLFAALCKASYHWSQEEDQEGWIILSLFSIVVAMFCAVAAFTYFTDAVAMFVNPEYYAIQKLLGR